MNEYGEMLEDGTLRFIRMLPGPIENVWAWLTEPEKRALWFAGGETATSPGGKAEFKFNHATLTDHDDPAPEQYKDMDNGVEMTGEVLVYDPPTRLVLLWQSESGDANEIDFELTAIGDEVKLVLLQKGLKKRADMLSASAGWHAHLGIMIAKLNGDEPWPFWATDQRLLKEYGKLLDPDIGE